MKITLAQLNPTIGDISGNTNLIKNAINKAAEDKSDLLVTPELSVTGYSPGDLLTRSHFIEKVDLAIEALCRYSKTVPDLGIIVGAPRRSTYHKKKFLYNAAVLICNGEVVFEQFKSKLPNYDVFDEHRYFKPTDTFRVFEFKDDILGITICEDIWDPEGLGGIYYKNDPMQNCYDQGATIGINLSASPFHVGKDKERQALLSRHVKTYQFPIVWVNQVGGNDDLIFDGHSFCMDQNENIIAALPAFKEAIQTIDIAPKKSVPYLPISSIETVYEALVLGLKDYVRKCGIKKCVLGLSGGIDSAVTCAIAVAALGKEAVHGLLMPSGHSSQGSIDDAISLAKNLGCDYHVLPISNLVNPYEELLKNNDILSDQSGLAEENLQARVRGTLVMAYANKENALALSTGNKSELAVGYCTLYGDMNGGVSVLGDVYKTQVYELADFINKTKVIIPVESIIKPPSAELRPDQKDDDSLPPYDVLDTILTYYVEYGMDGESIIQKTGFDKEIVEWIICTVQKNEHKRHQASLILKVTSRSFGRGWRFPIAAVIE